MSDTQPPGSDWISAWIEQQREQLGRAAADGCGSDLAARWFEAGQAYLRGLTQFAQSRQPDAGAADPVSARLNEEVQNAWEGVWGAAHATSGAAVQLILDVLGKTPPLGTIGEHAQAGRELAEALREYQELEQAL
ncbi:MAG TPA: hypothetical protein VHK24_12235, partial [Steroidobacter sp.]|nr:hypothetical protein [Steroidobacter sp.]